MKYLKMLGLVAIAAGALMAAAGAGSASATELTCGARVTCPVGTQLHAESEGHAVFDASFGKVECVSILEGTIFGPGGASETAYGPLSLLTFTACTNGAVVKVIQSGTFEIHSNGNGNGTLTSTGAEVTIEFFGAHCIYATNATSIGTVTGSTNTGAHATLDVSGAITHVSGRSGALCGFSTPWTGSYRVTSPSSLGID